MQQHLLYTLYSGFFFMLPLGCFLDSLALWHPRVHLHMIWLEIYGYQQEASFRWQKVFSQQWAHMRFLCGVLSGMTFSLRWFTDKTISANWCWIFDFLTVYDLFYQIFRALRSILNGFVAFFAACNRHRLRYEMSLLALICLNFYINMLVEWHLHVVRKPFHVWMFMKNVVQ